MLARTLARIQQVIMISLSFIMVWYYIRFIDMAKLQGLAVFIVLAALAEIMPSVLPQGGKISYAFVIELALIRIYNGPAEAVYAALISSLIGGVISELVGERVLKPGRLLGIIADSAGRVFIVTLAGLAYVAVPVDYLNLILAAAVYGCLDTLFLTLNKYYNAPFSFMKQMISYGRTVSLYYLIFSPLALLMSIIFIANASGNKARVQEMQIFSVLLFFMPLLLVNYSFRLYMNIRKSYDETIKSLAATIEARDPYMRGHAEKVAEKALLIAEEIGYKEKELRKFRYIVLLHDVGYLAISDQILEKTGSLTEDEYREIKKHVISGAEIISKIKFLENYAGIIRHHHENFDGSGYPDGLKGDEIPLGSRIIAIADAFDAMTTDRPNYPAKTVHEALQEMQVLAGKHFDPHLMGVFVNILRRRGEI